MFLSSKLVIVTSRQQGIDPAQTAPQTASLQAKSARGKAQGEKGRAKSTCRADLFRLWPLDSFHQEERMSEPKTVVSSWNEWDPLKHVIVGRADGCCIPAPEPALDAKVPEDLTCAASTGRDRRKRSIVPMSCSIILPPCWRSAASLLTGRHRLISISRQRRRIGKRNDVRLHAAA